MVREWTDSVIGQLKQKFETYAESYRAQAEQALGSRELAKGELDGLEENLARLKPPAAARSELREVDSKRQVDIRQETSSAAEQK